MLPSTLLLLTGWIFAGPDPEPSTALRKVPPGLAARIWETTDAVLDHHIEPPARQEMILLGMTSLYRAAGLAAPDGLARRVSAISTPTDLTPLLDETWSRLAGKITEQGEEMGADEFLLSAMLVTLPGGARLLTAQELKVEEQFAGNRYVGLQIALGVDPESKRPAITMVSEGGPADRAGVKKGDVIEEIDGTSTERLSTAKVVERLRGAEGTDVVIRVRQPKEADRRVITVTRGVLPKPTVRGIRDSFEGNMGVLIHDNDPIGCLKFGEILGSTPHELRVLARRLEDAGAKALILDLRSLRQAHLHPTVLLADSLLDGGTIGWLRTAGGVETFRAEPDALFQGWPLAVLVDNNTPHTALWLAAALQDNHRAVIVGSSAPSAPRTFDPRRGPLARNLVGAEVKSAVPVGDGSSSIEMTTGRLERSNGRALLAVAGDARSGLVPDIITTAPSARQPVTVRRETPLAPGLRLNRPQAAEPPRPDSRTSADPMDAAVQRLRELLKTP